MPNSNIVVALLLLLVIERFLSFWLRYTKGPLAPPDAEAIGRAVAAEFYRLREEFAGEFARQITDRLPQEIASQLDKIQGG